MRIASLLPSATEIVCALGLAHQLVGVSHECDYPAGVVKGLPKLTRSAIPLGLSSAETDRAVSERLRRGDSLYEIEEATLAELKPDLVITQELCDVCAVSYSEVKRLAAQLPGKPQVLSLTPPNLAGVFEDVVTVAEATDMAQPGAQLVDRLQARLAAVTEAVKGLPRPRVFGLEWLDPPFAAGHWVPEMIGLAGGDEVLGRAGEKSYRLTWEQVIATQPDVVFLIPCGYNAEQAQREWEALTKPMGWETIPAAQSGRIHALDANSWCSRPAPRIVDGVEQLARLIHPEVNWA